MPRQTVVARLSTDPPHEVAAHILSFITYPNSKDASERENFEIALARWSIYDRARVDKVWGKSAQPLKPYIFSQEQKAFLSIHRRGIRILFRRMVTAANMLGPHLNGFPSIKPAKITLKGVWGFDPSVETIALKIADRIGLARGSGSTVESKLWAPAKPVAHCATSFYLWSLYIDHSRPEELKALRSIGHIVQSDSWQLCGRDPFLAFFCFPSVLRDIIKLSEFLRLNLKRIKQFEIPEEDTIQFVIE
jgi:hypothetical protein